MKAKYFVTANRSGEVTYKPAEHAIAHNVDAYLSFDTPLPDMVLAQCDTEAQAKRFVDLMTKARAV